MQFPSRCFIFIATICCLHNYIICYNILFLFLSSFLQDIFLITETIYEHIVSFQKVEIMQLNARNLKNSN